MDSFNEKVKEVKLKALELISNKLVADISICELINLCACLNNNFKDDDYLKNAMDYFLKENATSCRSCDKKEESAKQLPEEPLE